jgi:hypothetical protein
MQQNLDSITQRWLSFRMFTPRPIEMLGNCKFLTINNCLCVEDWRLNGDTLYVQWVTEMIKMLVRHGNSFALILDKPVLELLNVDPARPVALSTTDGKSLLVVPLSGAKGRTAKRTRPRRRLGKTRKHIMKAIAILSIGALAAISAGCLSARQNVSATGGHYPWKKNIVTTVFWIGEKPSANNPVPNRISSWDRDWSRSYGGFDDPNPAHRRNFIPVKFTPRQNPFYCALPYNDKAATGHRPEASRVVPWFKEAYQGPGVSICKDRWVAIRKGNRTVYAQWEDAGPFRTDYWQYVFGNARPKPNLNKGAGLDVSPAVRDYLGLNQTDVTDWRFVEFSEVSRGPWSTLGENNTFVISDRKTGSELAQASKPAEDRAIAP